MGDRHPPTSGLISKVMSFWRALFHIVRQGSRLSAPSRAQGLLSHHCRACPLGGTHDQSIHWPKLLDSRPPRETGLSRETEAMQYGGRGRDHGTWDHLQVDWWDSTSSCSSDTALPHRCMVVDPVVSAEVCSGWKSPLSRLPYFSSLVQNGFFFNNECLQKALALKHILVLPE